MVLRRVFDFEEGGLVASLKTRVTRIEGRIFRFNTFNTTVLNKPCRKYKIKQQRKFSFVKYFLQRTNARSDFAVNSYRSYSVIRRTVFFKKFLISTKNYRQSLGASYRRIFSRNNFFLSQLLVRFQANKRTHSVGH